MKNYTQDILKMQEKINISVIIPAYNEYTTLKKLLYQLEKFDFILEIIVVNDGSNDETNSLSNFYKIILLEHKKNIGNGAAIKTGLLNAQGDWVLLLDADGQHPPEKIHNLVKYAEESDMVVGSRVWKNYCDFVRKIGNIVLIKIAEFLTKTDILDLTSGFRLIKKNKIMEIFEYLPDTFSYSTTTTLFFLLSGYRVKYVPIEEIKPRISGRSKIQLVRDGFRFFIIIFKIIFIYNFFLKKKK